jgi:hypothetical protein
MRGLRFNGGSFFQLDALVGFTVDDRSARTRCGADHSSIVHGSSGAYRVWLMQWLLGEQWRVLPRVQGFLRPLSSVHMVCGRRLLYGGSVLRIVDNFGVINGGADDSSAIDSSSVLSIVNNSGAINGGADDSGAIDGSSVHSIVDNSGAINGGADDSSAIDGSSVHSIVDNSGAINGGADDSSADCAVWLVQCVLGRQWRVLPRVQGILRPLPSVHMVRRASSLREPEALRTQSESRHVHAV